MIQDPAPNRERLRSELDALILYQKRGARIHLHRDEKILTAWRRTFLVGSFGPETWV